MGSNTCVVLRMGCDVTGHTRCFTLMMEESTARTPAAETRSTGGGLVGEEMIRVWVRRTVAQLTDLLGR